MISGTYLNERNRNHDAEVDIEYIHTLTGINLLTSSLEDAHFDNFITGILLNT